MGQKAHVFYIYLRKYFINQILYKLLLNFKEESICILGKNSCLLGDCLFGGCLLGSFLLAMIVPRKIGSKIN
jgi:hypothetical protein